MHCARVRAGRLKAYSRRRLLLADCRPHVLAAACLQTLLIAALRRAGYALYNKDEGRRGTTRADSTSRPNNPE